MPLPIATQRRFAIVGDNAFKIVDKLASNQRICRLLKYQVKNPFTTDLADVDGDSLIHSQLCIMPKIHDEPNEKMSYINIVFSNFTTNPVNPDTKICTLRFDILCPYDEWILEDNLRPFALMQEVDLMFNGKKLNGIGNLKFIKSDMIALTNQLGGYSMVYATDEFN